jgi:2,4-dienoyl-CoA reductase-like NADH-dependent reductase (Old Yellow Enzyme family)/NADPH-dependent 2,4-dienoyl-CoA reductase/sulfur reductase-like enzyme
MASRNEASHKRYPTVFKPMKLGPVEIPNRIYMAPHGIPLEVKSTGGDMLAEPALNRAYYFGERAAGGTGLIIHSTQVISSQTNFGESPGHEQAIPAFRRVAEEVHRHGSKIFAEIWYVNWIQKAWEKLGPEAPGLAPTALPTLYYPSVRKAMTLREIDLMVEAYARTTRNLRQAGYDGIELHVSHGSIVEYFLSPYFNKRADEYGGSMENRARLMVRLLEVIRREQGADQALGIRINADELLPGGLDEEATKEILIYLRGLGLVDFFDIDVSVEPEQVHLMTTGMFDPVMHNAERAGRVGEAAGDIPVLMTPGRLTSIADAEKLLASGKCSMVGAVRGLIADPHMVNKSRDGREKERRICVAINACVDPLGVGWGCAINAVAGKENRWANEFIAPVATPMNIVVVGGGPAGSEAARIAAERGNHVTLLERGQKLGGSILNWGALPGRESMRTLPNYFDVQLDRLGVDVRLGTEASAQAVLALQPDVVVVATGSKYNREGVSGPSPRPIPGHDLGHVLAPEDLFAGRSVSGKVVVVDDEGYHTGCGIAEMLAKSGCDVVYVARKMVVGASLGLAIGHVSTRLRLAGVKIVTGHMATAITEGTVTLYEAMTGAESVEQGVDHVVLTTCRDAVDDLSEALEGKIPYIYLIGDALAPRGLREATYEGHRFGRLIGDPEMPASVSEELFRADSASALVSAAEG